MTLSNRRKDVKDWKYVNEMGFGSFRNSEVKMDTMGHNRVFPKEYLQWSIYCLKLSICIHVSICVLLQIYIYT